MNRPTPSADLDPAGRADLFAEGRSAPFGVAGLAAAWRLARTTR